MQQKSTKIFLCSFLLVALFALCNANFQGDCETIRVRCGYCVRSLYAGDEDNLIGRVNINCQKKVGQMYVWRPIDRCQMLYMRCRAINVKLTCAAMAEILGMTRRLQ